MNINRNNYEELFMLYADNELPAAQRKEVEAFVTANPDLKHELELFNQFKLSPDETVVFSDKHFLLKQKENNLGITIGNCESFFVLYADNELANDEKAAVESFVYKNPSVQANFELLQQAKFDSDNHIVFENKESLYRHEEDDKVVPFRWWRMAAAAAVLVFVSGFFWFNSGKNTGTTDTVRDTKKAQPAKELHIPVIKDSIVEKVNPAQSVTRENIAAATDKKNGVEKAAIKSMAITNSVKEIKNKNSNLPVVQRVTIKEELAVNDGSKTDGRNLKSTTVDPIQTQRVEPVKPLIAAAKQALPDQPTVIAGTNENQVKAEFASLNNDNIEVLNTSVNTKNSLRGFLRKASRMITRKTNTGNDDGNQKKGILIGGFEIAVR